MFQITFKNQNRRSTFFNYGNVLFSNGQISESVTYFQESLKIVPDDPTTLVNLATSLYRLDLHDRAIAHYEEASKYAQGFGQYFNWGYIYESRKDYDRAIQSKILHFFGFCFLINIIVILLRKITSTGVYDVISNFSFGH